MLSQSCHVSRHNDLGGQSSLSGINSASLFCGWKIAAVKINSGVYLLEIYIRQVPLFTDSGLGLVGGGLGVGIVILFLVF